MTIFAFFNQSLKKNQLESKLDFAFVSFSNKLNCLDFCYYYFFFLTNEYIVYTVSI